MEESWGSLLGIFLISEKPEEFAGFIGTGQMVAIEETEKIDYQFVLKDARKKGNTKLVKKLEKQGEPLYTKGNVALLVNNYLGYLTSYMYSNPKIAPGSFDMMKYMFAEEYGLMDSLNYGLGLLNTFNVVYPQLYDVDLRETHTKVDVPVYFFEGRYDLNAPTSLVEDYYELLEAPKKEFIWFEHSGHCQWSSEPELFVSETVRVFLN